MRLQRSSVRIVGTWTAANGVVHGRCLGSGKEREPYMHGLRTLCMKPWKLTDSEHGPANEKGLRRVDFLNFYARVECETCVRALDQMICGALKPDEQQRLDALYETRSLTRAIELEDNAC